ncbi:alpha/beta fold hydrolase [Isoptericola sp. NPDC057653]|uniref:alpha/beta fold hydrolase n=1 Tax=Isoptericola sp. NPDC057653 TaxID=3346195 RepID=UPI0036A1F6EF
MDTQYPTVVLVHGAFAESASWNGVIDRLHEQGIEAVAAANPLRGVAGDAAYVRDVVAGIGRPVLLVGHSYGGIVITEAASQNPDVVGLVYVAAFAPDRGESAFELSSRAPGSTLGDALAAYPLSAGGNELAIRVDAFPAQFAADVPLAEAVRLARTQRPVTETALRDGLPTDTPAWQSLPSWFIFGDQDRNIPAAELRAEAQRARARGVNEVPGASHALAISRPYEVTNTILEALGADVTEEVA